MAWLRILLCFTVLLLAVAGRAQKSHPYAFTFLNTGNGLADNAVTEVVQDHQGYIWIATNNGLQRYDGKRFLTIRQKAGDATSVPDNSLSTIFEDRKQNLWLVSHEDRIGTFNTATFRFRPARVQTAGEQDFFGIKDMFEDGQGNVYVFVRGRKRSVYQYFPEENLFRPAPWIDALPANWTLNNFYFDPHANRCWFAADSGLIVYDPVKKLTAYRDHNPLNDPIIAAFANQMHIDLVHVDAKGRLAMVTWKVFPEPPRFHFFDPATRTYRQHTPFPDVTQTYNQFNAIVSQKNGRLWLCGLPFVAEYKVDEGQFDFLPLNDTCDRSSPLFSIAIHIFEDREQNLWVCTNQGLLHFTPDAHLFQSIPIESGAALYEMQNGQIWVGCTDSGLHTFDQQLKPVIPAGNPAARFRNQSVHAIYQQRENGLVWLGFSRGKIGVYDPVTGVLQELQPEALQGKRVENIAEDQNGNLWFNGASMEGALVVKWDRKRAAGNMNEGFITVLNNRYRVSDMLIDKNNSLWLGFLEDGVYRIDANTNRQVARIDMRNPEVNGNRVNGVSDLLLYNDSLLVAASSVLALINTNSNGVSYVSRDDGLPGTVLALEKDRNGMLWLGMNMANMVRFNLQKKIFNTYGQRDGYPEYYVRPATGMALRDGRMLYATSSGLLLFNPADMEQSPAPPPALITDFRLVNASLPVDSLLKLDRVRLPYDQNAVTIEFSALRFKPQNKINYYYRMEGLDNGWVMADETQRAIYNYLPPGRYTFLIRTDDGSPNSASQITSLFVYVQAPFWKTWWFYALLVLVISGLLFLLDRERIKRLVSLQRMRTQIAVNLHKEVSSTLGNINMLSEMARIKADRDIDRSKEYIQQISDKSNRMIVAMDDILWSIEPENDSMEKSLLRMREYIDSLKSRHGANITLHTDVYARRLKLDMKKRHEFFLLFKLALHTLVCDAGGRDTLVHLEISRNRLMLQLQDTTADAGNNAPVVDEALKEIYQRCALINAEADILADRYGMGIIIQMNR